MSFRFGQGPQEFLFYMLYRENEEEYQVLVGRFCTIYLHLVHFVCSLYPTAEEGD